MGRNSRCEGFPDGKEFRCEGIPGGKEFPVGRISWWEGIPSVKDFPVEDFLVGRNSRSWC